MLKRRVLANVLRTRPVLTGQAAIGHGVGHVGNAPLFNRGHELARSKLVGGALRTKATVHAEDDIGEKTAHKQDIEPRHAGRPAPTGTATGTARSVARPTRTPEPQLERIVKRRAGRIRRFGAGRVILLIAIA